MHAVAYAIIAMLVVILIYDQLLFRPLVTWSQRFNMGDVATEQLATSWVYTLLKRTRFIQRIGNVFGKLADVFINLSLFATQKQAKKIVRAHYSFHDKLWFLLVVLFCLGITYSFIHYILMHVTVMEMLRVLFYGLITATRVMILILICSLIWIPIGVWVGLRPKWTAVVQPLAQFLAAFPANLLFPIVVIGILKFNLNVEIWTAPLMVLGTQWYILFNVIAASSTIPRDIYQAAQIFGVQRWVWWKRVCLPAIFPYFITGALAAAGGAWNASIVAEVVEWGDTTLVATGLGAYITQYTRTGDFPRIVLGIGVMCLYIVIINRLLWQRLYHIAQQRYRLD
jgi:NitT/TauT family transport system permease protein